MLPPELTETQTQVVIPFKKNWEAVKQLEQEHELLAVEWAVSSCAAGGAYLFAPLIPPVAVAAGAAVAAATWTQWRDKKVFRLLETTKSLLKTFESKGIEIYERLPVEGMNPIDLFVRFPQRTHLFISIRSKGKTEIVYNEATEELIVKKENNKTSKWEPNPLVELADYKNWLSKNRQLFGMSAKEAQKTPTAKILLLWQPTKADEHREELYSEIGSLKTLVLKRKGSAFVIQQEELLNFVEAWLARYE